MASAVQSGTASAIRSVVLTSSSPTRGRRSNAEAVPHPVRIAAQLVKASGNNASNEIRIAAPVSHRSAGRPRHS
jgi:hypothetical protein